MKNYVAIYLLDVGQGDCSIVRLPDDRVVVFDCADDRTLRNILTDWSTPKIDAFILSHLDQDHIAGALQFLQGWTQPISTVYAPIDRDISNDHDEAQRAKKLLDNMGEHGRDEPPRMRRWEVVPTARDPRPVASGEDAAGSRWSLTLLAPSTVQRIKTDRLGEWEDPNRYSAILRIQVGANAMLIGGDAPLLTWSELPAAERPAKVFRIPHHGGALDDGGIPPQWDVARLYREVGADTALVSVGTNNGHAHPREEWVAPISGGACRMLCTQVTPKCHTALERIGANGEKERDPDKIDELRRQVITQQNQWTEPQYRHLTDKRHAIRKEQLEVPCAGTVIVRMYFDGRVDVLPFPQGGHEQVIDEWSQPLCRQA